MTRRGCSSCRHIRWFLMSAGPLIAALYLQPGWVTTVAGRMPSPLAIGLGISGLAAVVFVFRLAGYLRERR